jgi:high-affinity iron transporter
MIPSFIITFRETLEAALVVGIVLSYLYRVKQTKHNNVVYAGVISGIVASIIGAILFTALAGGFTGRSEEIFEGITMLAGALLLTTMILWMMKQKHIAKKLENKVAAELTKAHTFGMFSLVFIAVFREGIETVIFLRAASFVSESSNMIGALAGIIAAHGVHELQEAKVIPTIVEHVWDINPPLKPDGSYPTLHEKGYIGSILKSLLGYNGNPSLIEVMSYFVYLALVFALWKGIERSKRANLHLMKGKLETAAH